MVEDPFPDLAIADTTFLDTTESRHKCKRCTKSRKFFCYTCCSPNPQIQDKLPKVEVSIYFKKTKKVLYMLQCSKTNDILSDHLLWYVMTTSSSMEIFVRWCLLSASTWQAVCWLHFLTYMVKKVYVMTSVCCDQLFLDLFNTELLLQRYWQGLRLREVCVCVCGQGRGGGGGKLYPTRHCHHQNDSALRLALRCAISVFHWAWGAKSEDSVYNNNNVHLSCTHQRLEHSRDTYYLLT